MFNFSDNSNINEVLNELLKDSINLNKLNSLCIYYDLDYDIEFIGDVDDLSDDMFCFNFTFTRDNGNIEYNKVAYNKITQLFDDAYDNSYDDRYQFQANLMIDPEVLADYLD